jgi:hypothetical protein
MPEQRPRVGKQIEVLSRSGACWQLWKVVERVGMRFAARSRYSDTYWFHDCDVGETWRWPAKGADDA